jgi:hypothetical protein
VVWRWRWQWKGGFFFVVIQRCLRLALLLRLFFLMSASQVLISTGIFFTLSPLRALCPDRRHRNSLCRRAWSFRRCELPDWEHQRRSGAQGQGEGRRDEEKVESGRREG